MSPISARSKTSAGHANNWHRRRSAAFLVRASPLPSTVIRQRLLTACLRPILCPPGAVGVFPIRVPIPSRAEIGILKRRGHGAARGGRTVRQGSSRLGSPSVQEFGTANMIVDPATTASVSPPFEMRFRRQHIAKLCCDGRTVDQGQYRCDPPVAEAIEDVLREAESFAVR
jgi:hypothetical protein